MGPVGQSPGEEHLTFLFTDISGSSGLWERYPAAMPGVVEQHEQVIATVVQQCGGTVFKTVGDQLCAAFSDPRAALLAAVDAQRQITAISWGALGLPEPLRVRIGLHCGDAVARDGDYFGPPLNKISRLLEIGHGGQVLTTGAVLDQMSDALPTGITVIDLGKRRLRDFPGVEPVFQLAAAGLPETFPPLASLDLRPSYLPLPPASMVGRIEAARQIRALLNDPVIRLVTITGLGGSGKTRLAVHVSNQVVDTFADGAWFIDLASISHADQVPSAIARVLNVREQSGRRVEETLGNWLGTRELLLLLDNCEHLSPGLAPFVALLLASCPGITILATSREVLNLRGERRFILAPLDLPGESGGEFGPLLEQIESVELLIQRVRDSGTELAITGDNAGVVKQISRRLDGLPLAIEIAAPHIAVQGPVSFLEHLDGRLLHLEASAVDLPERQRSLHAVLESSDDYLPPTERRLLHRLSVFTGGWTGEAAAAIDAAPEGPPDLDRTFDLLAALVRKSLVISQPNASPAGRYRLLETIREYAAAALLADGDLVTCRHAHAIYFAGVARDAATHFHDEDAVHWLTILDADHANLLATLAWLIDEGQPELDALAMATHLWPFWDQHGYPREGRFWLERALAKSTVDDPQLRAIALRFLGNSYQYDPPVAVMHYEESYRLATGASLPYEASGALFGLGQIALIRGDYQRAAEITDQFLAESERNEQPEAIVSGQMWRAHIACDAGRLETATTAAEMGIRQANDCGATGWRTWGMLTLGRVARLQDRRAEAIVILQSALAEAETLGDKTLQAFLQNELAHAKLPIDTAVARAWLEKSLQEMRDWDAERELAASLEVGVMLLVAEGDAPAALQVAATVSLWRESHQAPLALSERAGYERFLTLAHIQVEPAPREEAINRGRTTSLQSCCDIVLHRD